MIRALSHAFWTVCVLLTPAVSFAVLPTVTCSESKAHLIIEWRGKHVLTYNKTAETPKGVDPSYARSGFIHPITTPSGRVLTDDYPLPHHSHQHGLFFAWKKAVYDGQEVNFWEHHHSGATVRHEEVLEVINNEDRAGFRVLLAHTFEDRPVLWETWEVLVSAESGFVDLVSVQSCATDKPLHLEPYHYGALAFRGAREWFDVGFEKAQAAARKAGRETEEEEPCRILTSEGRTRFDGNHTRPKWVCMTGPIQEAPVSITLIPHPSNDRYPQHVRLHPSMPYFCFIPTVEEKLEIRPGTPWVSRYRIVAQDGEADGAALNALQRAYVAETD